MAQDAHPSLRETLGLEHPIVLAPMSGGAGTVELAAAVCNAGGLGSLGAAYLTPDRISEEIRRLRMLTDRPFNVNLFVAFYGENKTDPRPMLELLASVHEELGLPAPVLPAMPQDPFLDQLEAVLEARPAVFSFTFGRPDHEAMARLKARGILTAGTATSLREAEALDRTGVDAVVAQGAEAGGHRGTFSGFSVEQSLWPTVALTSTIRSAVPLPVIASGGIMDGAGIMEALRCGADAVQMGTAFLPCPESGASDAWKQAILGATADTTVITRAFSGRAARGLTNRFVEMLAGHEEWILPFPLQNDLTRPMRRAAAQLGEVGYLSLWAGQGVTKARSLPARDLVQRLVAEMAAAESAAS